MDAIFAQYPQLASVLVWLGVALVLAVLEAMSVQLIAIWFALGALVTAIPAWFEASVSVQLVVFVLVSAVALAATRPLVRHVLQKESVHTNTDALIGEVGIVQQAIDNVRGEGRVTAGGLDWSARSLTGEPIEPATEVVIERIEGVKLIVRPVQGQNKE